MIFGKKQHTDTGYDKKNGKDVSRRNFLKMIGGGALTATAVMTGCKKTEQTRAAE